MDANSHVNSAAPPPVFHDGYDTLARSYLEIRSRFGFAERSPRRATGSDELRDRCAGVEHSGDVGRDRRPQADDARIDERVHDRTHQILDTDLVRRRDADFAVGCAYHLAHLQSAAGESERA